MSDLDPKVFQAQESCQCECQDILSRARSAVRELKELTLERVQITIQVDSNGRDFYGVRIGDNYDDTDITRFSHDFDNATSEVKQVLSKRKSPEYARALALQKEASEILARLK